MDFDNADMLKRVSEDLQRQRDEEYRKFKIMMKRYLKENK